MSVCLLLIFLFLTQRRDKAMIKNILNGSWGQGWVSLTSCRGYLRGWTPYNWQGGPTIKSYQVLNSNITNAENSLFKSKENFPKGAGRFPPFQCHLPFPSFSPCSSYISLSLAYKVISRNTALKIASHYKCNFLP